MGGDPKPPCHQASGDMSIGHAAMTTTTALPPRPRLNLKAANALIFRNFMRRDVVLMLCDSFRNQEATEGCITFLTAYTMWYNEWPNKIERHVLSLICSGEIDVVLLRRSWKRDLTREGVEPNPGFNFKDFKICPLPCQENGKFFCDGHCAYEHHDQCVRCGISHLGVCIPKWRMQKYVPRAYKRVENLCATGRQIEVLGEPCIEAECRDVAMLAPEPKPQETLERSEPLLPTNTVVETQEKPQKSGLVDFWKSVAKCIVDTCKTVGMVTGLVQKPQLPLSKLDSHRFLALVGREPVDNHDGTALVSNEDDILSLPSATSVFDDPVRVYTDANVTVMSQERVECDQIDKIYQQVDRVPRKWWMKLLTPVTACLMAMFAPPSAVVPATAVVGATSTSVLSSTAAMLRKIAISKFITPVRYGLLADYYVRLHEPRVERMTLIECLYSTLMRVANAIIDVSGGERVPGAVFPRSKLILNSAADERHSSASTSKLDVNEVVLYHQSYVNFENFTKTSFFTIPELASELSAYSMIAATVQSESIRRRAFSQTQLNMPSLFRECVVSDTVSLAMVMRTSSVSASTEVNNLNGMWGPVGTWLATVTVLVIAKAYWPLIHSSIMSASTMMRAAAELLYSTVSGQF